MTLIMYPPNFAIKADAPFVPLLDKACNSFSGDISCNRSKRLKVHSKCLKITFESHELSLLLEWFPNLQSLHSAEHIADSFAKQFY